MNLQNTQILLHFSDMVKFNFNISIFAANNEGLTNDKK